MAMRDVITRLESPVDGRSLRVVRAGLGVLLAIALVRLHLTGWTAPLFFEPTFRFPYEAFAFVPPIPRGAVVWILSLGAGSALVFGFAQGHARRVGGLVLLGCFGWLKLFDVTNYLNHDYLAVLLVTLLTVLPLDGATVPRWALWLVRVQIAVVYVNAGLAKVNTDWLLGAEPLTTWFAANRGLPLLGPLLALPHAALVGSWAACLYDLTIPFWLSCGKTRRWAFVVLLVFHGTTHALFDIGLFPFIMTLAATIFFEPGWPERLGLRAAPSTAPAPARASRRGLVFAAAWAAFQVLFPLRSHVLSDDVLWDEQGMRWSWKVMLREKNGSITYRARPVGQAREWLIDPLDVLTPRQANEMSGQPDLIVALGQHLGRDLSQRFGRPVEVYVDALVSLNGRPPARLFKPDVDLMTLEGSDLRGALLPSPRSAALVQVAGW